MAFKLGDKFFLEIDNDRQLNEYEIVSQIATFINKMKTVFNLLSDEEIDEYNNIYNDKPAEEFIKWIEQKCKEY